MKPIKLKIKGLNSFVEEQNVDFEKLTSRGLFGIFGPTGSGKSTILDGITLALYGEVARKSSNFINTNCQSANVSFEFQISGAEVKRYLVEREFKIDKKTGNVRSGKCKIADITLDEPELLAETVSTVTAKCKDIIGLTLEDFTRTVVLPQGKFSEFLKLEGKARRDMLERLFNLQQYGDDLSRKLSRKIGLEKTENSVLLGQLTGYEDVSEEVLTKKESELNELRSKLKELNKEYLQIIEEFKLGEEVWNLQLELNSHKEKKIKLSERENHIKDLEEKVKVSESAEKVIPYVNSYENLLKDINITKAEISKLKELLDKIREDKKNIDINWERAKERRDNELSQLKVKEQKVKDALEEEEAIKALDKDIEILNNNIENKIIEEKEKSKLVVNTQEEINKLIDLIKNTELEVEVLQIDNELKHKVQEGVRVKDRFIELEKNIESIKSKIDILEKKINSDKEKELEFNIRIENKRKEYSKEKSILDKLIKDSPGEPDDLLNIQKEITINTEKWNKYKLCVKEIDEAQLSIKEYTLKLEEFIKDKSILEKEIADNKNKLKLIEQESLANKLRKELKDGEVCPVCGSTEHFKENIHAIDIKESSELENEISSKEGNLKSVEANITKIDTNISLLNKRVVDKKDEIAELGNEFLGIKVEDLEEKFNKLKEAIKVYDTRKKELEESINKIKEEGFALNEQISSTKVLIENNVKSVNDLKEELKISTELYQSTLQILNNLMDETGIDNFIEKNKEFLELEKKKEELSKVLKLKRIELDKLNESSTVLNNSLNLIKENLVKSKAEVFEKEKYRAEKLNSIKSKIGIENNIKELLDNVTNTIKEIEVTFELAEKSKVEIDEKYQQINESYIEKMANESSLNSRFIIEQKSLEKAMKDNSFSSIEEVKSNILDNHSLSEFKKEIEKHNEDIAKINGTIESIILKLNNRNIDEAMWKQLNENKINKENEINNLNEVIIKINEEVKQLKQKLLELNELLEKKKELDHKLALLNALEKLFKGKKFVEFVATSRLKYISLEASKRLKEISNGTYGLEIDENGKFIIRDYKNGGASRDASTLSGGEVFITSLALALALSAEIQLKGTSPLELFFLDEGFGTLDDNLLDIVMGSLERIHNDKLKIGIISHVESIKNRVPVKLIVTPSEAGKGGSKVNIELS